MQKKYISPITLFLNATILTISGLILIFKPTLAFGIIFLSAKIILILEAINALLSFLSLKKSKALQEGIVYILSSVLVLAFPKFFAGSISKLFAFFACILALVHIISGINFKKDGVKGWKNQLIWGIISLVFAVLIFKNPLASFIKITKLIGIYLIF